MIKPCETSSGHIFRSCGVDTHELYPCMVRALILAYLSLRAREPTSLRAYEPTSLRAYKPTSPRLFQP